MKYISLAMFKITPKVLQIFTFLATVCGLVLMLINKNPATAKLAFYLSKLTPME